MFTTNDDEEYLKNYDDAISSYSCPKKFTSLFYYNVVILTNLILVIIDEATII